MSRYIDADALIEELQRCSYDTWSKDINRTWWAQSVKVKDNIIECIERQPTADVVEVVRCKDCEYYITTDMKYPYCSMMSNKGEGEYYCPFEDHYCSNGERK